MSEQQKRDGISRRSWLLGCMGMIALCAGLAYAQWFFWGYVPLSTLPMESYSPRPIDEICPSRDPLSRHLYSPDGKYYIDMDFSRYREARVARLFRASDHQLLGTHSYRAVSILCWAQDSRGVHITEKGSGFSSYAVGIPTIRPLPREDKKILVPCQSKLDGVPLLPRLYWELRCALPGSEHSPFATWFPLAVLLLGLGGMVIVVRKLWKKWINPCWHGSE